MTYRKYNTYGRLRTVMLGSYFYPEFFSKISQDNVREPLMRIAEEINEDLSEFEKILLDHDVTVMRGPQPTGYFDQNNPYKPPLQVRNTHAVIGEYMYQFNPDYFNAIDPILRSYCSDVVDLTDSNSNFYIESMEHAKSNYNEKLDLWYSQSKYQELSGYSWPSYGDYVRGIRSDNDIISQELAQFEKTIEYETKELGPLQGPNIINTNEYICVDANEYCDYVSWLSARINDPRPIKQFTSKAGHVDGCFAILGNKTILGIDPLIDYAKFFPEYTVVCVPPESYQDQMHEFNLMKKKVNGAWWVQGEEHNDEFINYVETHLRPWIGYVAESIFDVNVLPLDDHTIFVSNITPEIRANLQSRGIECILVPWRHRFFVDGGLHCITLDLYRND